MQNLKAEKWILKYVDGSYETKDKKLHNIPTNVDRLLKKSISIRKKDKIEMITQLKEVRKTPELDPSILKQVDTVIASLKEPYDTVYRGLYFSNQDKFNKWLQNEVSDFNENKEEISLKTKTITSWSDNSDISQIFANNNILAKTKSPNQVDENPISILLSTTVKENHIYGDVDRSLNSDII